MEHCTRQRSPVGTGLLSPVSRLSAAEMLARRQREMFQISVVRQLPLL